MCVGNGVWKICLSCCMKQADMADSFCFVGKRYPLCSGIFCTGREREYWQSHCGGKHSLVSHKQREPGGAASGTRFEKPMSHLYPHHPDYEHVTNWIGATSDTRSSLKHAWCKGLFAQRFFLPESKSKSKNAHVRKRACHETCHVGLDD